MYFSFGAHVFFYPFKQFFFSIFFYSIETRVLLLSWVILDCKKVNITPNLQGRLEGASWQLRLASLFLIPKKMMEQTVLKTITKTIKNKMMIENSQHGFTKVKLCLTHQVAFDDEMMGSVGLQTAADAVYLGLRKAWKAFVSLTNSMDFVCG